MKTIKNKSTKLHFVNWLPKKYKDDYDGPCKLPIMNYDGEEELPTIVTLNNFGILEAWYWYAKGCYEGSGHMLVHMNDGYWNLYDLCHCSCNGPIAWVQGPPLEGAKKSLQELQYSCSEDLQNEVYRLFNEAKKVTK